MPTSYDRYPPIDPGDPMVRLEERLRTIENGLHEQGNRNPLNRGFFSGTLRNVDQDQITLGVWGPDGFTFYDTAGNVVAVLGNTGVRMLDADAETRFHVGKLGPDTYGVIVHDADGATARFWVDETGIRTPFLVAPVVAADDFQTVTSASFEVTHRAQHEMITSQGLYCWVTATADVGTTGEFRIHEPFTGTSTAAVTVPSGSTGTTQQFRWLHGLDLNAGPVVFEIQARRTGGAGNVNVYRSPGVWMTDPQLCVADGVA